MIDKEFAVLDYSCSRIFRKLLLTISKLPVWTGRFRCRLLRWGGVNIGNGCFVGANVTFDTLCPELIFIGNNCCITSGTKIISHFFSPYDRKMYLGEVHIGSNVFVGMNTLIVSSVNIGEYAVIGAGSVLTKNVPPSEIWAGNPARLIRKIN